MILVGRGEDEGGEEGEGEDEGGEGGMASTRVRGRTRGQEV